MRIDSRRGHIANQDISVDKHEHTRLLQYLRCLYGKRCHYCGRRVAGRTRWDEGGAPGAGYDGSTS